MKQRVIVSALIKKDDKYLFIRQNKEGGAYPNTLHIPGGGLEIGETPEDGVIREIMEETNISIKNLKTFDFDSDIIEYKGEKTQFVFLRFLAEYDEGVPTPSSDAKEIVWLKKSEITKFEHNPPSLRLLGKVGLI